MVEYNSKIQDLQDQISKTKYNKRTQHAIGLMKAQLARLKDKQEARSSKKYSGDGYQVRKSGDGTAILLGFPSVGKSTLLNALTNANSEVGAYAFTTLKVVPGLMEYNHAQIQILDVPGVIRGAAAGTGRGKEVLATMRNADLCIILLDVQHPGHLKILKQEIFDAMIRLDKKKPDIRIKKTAKNGIRIGKTVKLPKLDDETIKSILKEFRINNADVLIRSQIEDDDLIDVIESNRVYMPSLVLLNKIDLVSERKLNDVLEATKVDLAISAEKKEHIEELKKLIYERMEFIRIYMKQPGKPADMDVPLIMKKGSTIRDVCNKLHRDFVNKFKFARVSGPSAKFSGQMFRLHHVLQDNDVLELHVR
ncbi:GTP-binding protein [Candidatus Woesearchaeota archaeon]|nr:GTP-binding protein [Candidatus Woesearchaeota archaeon]